MRCIVIVNSSKWSAPLMFQLWILYCGVTWRIWAVWEEKHNNSNPKKTKGPSVLTFASGLNIANIYEMTQVKSSSCNSSRQNRFPVKMFLPKIYLKLAMKESRFESWCRAVFVKRPFWLTTLGLFWQRAVLTEGCFGPSKVGPFW